MKEIIGREIKIKRGKLNENIIINEVNIIVNGIFSVTGRNNKKQITATMTIEEINENLIKGGLH